MSNFKYISSSLLSCNLDELTTNFEAIKETCKVKSYVLTAKDPEQVIAWNPVLNNLIPFLDLNLETTKRLKSYLEKEDFIVYYYFEEIDDSKVLISIEGGYLSQVEAELSLVALVDNITLGATTSYLDKDTNVLARLKLLLFRNDLRLIETACKQVVCYKHPFFEITGASFSDRSNESLLDIAVQLEQDVRDNENLIHSLEQLSDYLVSKYQGTKLN